MVRLLTLVLAALVAGLLWAPGPPPPVSPSTPAAESVAAPTSPPPGYLARFGDARLRHPAPVKSLALTPDGKLLATTTATEPVIRFWDTATAKLVRQLRIDAEFTERITLLRFTPDARRLVVVRHQWRQWVSPSHKWSEPSTLDAETGAITRWGWGVEGKGHGLPIPILSPDGQTAVWPDWRRRGGNGPDAFQRSSHAAVWSVATGQKLRDLPGWEQDAAGGCFSPDGTQVACVADARAVLVGPVDGSRPPRRFEVGTGGGEVRSFVWPRPDRLVAVWHNGLAALDPATGRGLARANAVGANLTSNPRAAGGDLLFVKEDTDRDVVAIDLTTLARVQDREFRGSRRDEPFAASADGKTLALGCGHAVRLFDTTTGASRHPELDRCPLEPVDRLEFSADGRRLLTAGGRSAQTWDLPDGRVLAAFEQRSFLRPPGWSLSPDGRRVAGGWTADGRSLVRDAATGAEVFREPAGPDGRGSAWSAVEFAGSDRLWVLDHRTSDFTAVGLTDGKLGPTLAGFPGATFVLASADGRRLTASGAVALAVRTDDPAGKWVEVESNRDRQRPKCGMSPPDCAIPVRFSRDGRRLLTWDYGHVLWDVAGTPHLVGRLSRGGAPEWYSRDGSFSPDGRRVAAVVHEEKGKTSVRVWEAASVAEVARLDVPGGASACAFTRDGQRLVVAHPDTTFSVWDYAALEAKALAAKAGDTWTDLANPDPKVGLAAVRDFAADPNAVRLLRERFTAPDQTKLTKLIAELDAPAFADREAASRELAALGDAAEPALRAAAKDSASAEVRQRAETLLRRLFPIDGGRSAARLRAVRAVEVLERVGTPEAAALVREWAANGRMPVRAAEAEAAAARLVGR